MRNLKKVLALALATVMLLGMMAMASAADYADEAQITAKYDYAVDVMQAIGVFEGTKTADGTYLYPANNLSRAEAAKVITFVALTKANASKLGTAEAPFADVAADHWAAGAIAYAKNLGIVSGKGENKYDPQGTLTGYEFAKMLLVVLGYKADVEGFTGSGWSTNIDSVALSAGLKKNLDINMGAYITREEACQMAVNALQADCVQYSGNTNISFGDTVIAIGGNRSKTEQTLMQKLYPNLQKSAVADNAFGYDVYTWTNGTTAVASEPAYTVLASYPGTAATLTKGAIYNLFGVEGTGYHVYVNGADTETVEADKGSTAVETTLGKYTGAQVEFVKNVSGSKEVIVTLPTLTKVIKVTDATTTTARKVQLDVNANGAFNTGVDYEIETTKYAVGDYVLAYVAGTPAAVKKHVAAETVYGTLTQTGKTAGKVTTMYIDGVAIPVAGQKLDDAAAFGLARDFVDSATNVNKKYTVVLSNGYAVAAIGDAATASLTNVVYVYGGGKLSGNYTSGTDKYQVDVFNMDGTKASLKLTETEFVTNLSLNTTWDENDNGLYLIEATDAAGNKDLTKVTDGLADGKATLGFKAGAVTKNTADKSETVASSAKAYYTDRAKVLTIAADFTKAAVADMPAYAVFDTETYIISSETKTGSDVYEIEFIVTVGTPTVATADLYYTIGTEVGRVYVAAAEKSYVQYNVYNVATGEKVKVMAAGAPGTGLKALTKVDENGVYTFDSTATTPKCYDETATVSVYGNYMSIDDADNTKDFNDYDYTAAIVVDNTTAGIKSIADLDAKLDTAPYQLEYSVIVDATAGAEKVLFVIVTAYTKTAP